LSLGKQASSMMPPEPMTASKLERWTKDSQKLMQQAESAFNGPEMAAAVLQMRRATAIAVNCTKGVVDAAGRQAGKPKPSRRSTKTGASPDQAEWLDELSVGRGRETDIDKFTKFQLQLQKEARDKKREAAAGAGRGSRGGAGGAAINTEVR
jgi:hypothetical protein